MARTDRVGVFSKCVDRVDRAVHREKNGQLNQHRQAGREGVDSVLLIEFGDFLLHPLARGDVSLSLVLRLNLLHLGLNNGGAPHALQLLEVQRDDEHAHKDGQQDDGDNPCKSCT